MRGKRWYIHAPGSAVVWTARRGAGERIARPAGQKPRLAVGGNGEGRVEQTEFEFAQSGLFCMSLYVFNKP